MRWRVRLAVVAVFLVGVFAAACQNGAVPVDHSSSLADPTATNSPSPATSLTPLPADPLVTADACNIAGIATTATIEVFTEQFAKIEEAAARKDQAAVLAAAAAISAQFQGLATTLTELAKRQVTPQLKAALLDVAAAVTQMASSPSYMGSPVDIPTTLADFSAAITAACAPPASATVTATSRPA